jgi:hypothetical protein
MIPKHFIDYYGDQTRWFVGKVVDNNDPKKLGRVKVNVYGVYDDIAPEDLPWAQIVVPVTQGVHKSTGQYVGLLVGTNVFGMFLDGPNSQLPLVIGAMPKEGDDNSLAEENYPYNKVYETERGHYKEYDDTEGKERIKERHRSGTHYEMLEDGTLKIKVMNDCIIEVVNDCNITVKGVTTIDSTKGINLISGAGVSINGKTF